MHASAPIMLFLSRMTPFSLSIHFIVERLIFDLCYSAVDEQVIVCSTI